MKKCYRGGRTDTAFIYSDVHIKYVIFIVYLNIYYLREPKSGHPKGCLSQLIWVHDVSQHWHRTVMKYWTFLHHRLKTAEWLNELLSHWLWNTNISPATGFWSGKKTSFNFNAALWLTFMTLNSDTYQISHTHSALYIRIYILKVRINSFCNWVFAWDGTRLLSPFNYPV